MEQKLVKVPFEVELAKKITKGEEEGRIVTRKGRNARIICWDAHCDDNIVALIEDEEGVEFPKNYVSDGMVFLTGKSECDLMLEIPEYMTFKDGDVLYVRLKNNNWYIFIYSCNSEYKTNSYAALGDNGRLWIEDNYITSNDCISELRFATESEKQKLIEALKASKEPKAKDCLKMLGVEVKPECEFKPKDWVLCKDDEGEWYLEIFSHKRNNGEFACIGSIWKYCIPYNEQTKHLLGTTDNWEG